MPMSFGQRHPSDPPRLLHLVLGEQERKIDFVLVRGAVLTGSVYDEYGDPASGRYVSPMKVGFVGGQRRLGTAGSPTTTNDIGEFRLAGLPPGEYFLQVTTRIGLGGVFEGTDGHAPTYFPGFVDPDVAQPISVDVGETYSGISINLVRSRLNTIGGRVNIPDGETFVNGSINVSTRSGAPISVASGRVGPDGSFKVAGIPNGEYLVRADSFASGRDGVPASAVQIVSLIEADILDLVLEFPQWAHVSGRVRLPVASERPSAFKKPVRVGVVPWEAGAPLWDVDLSRDVNPDGMFNVRAVPGKSAVFVTGLPDGFSVDEIRLGERVVTHEPLDVGPAAVVTDLVISLTRDAPTVAGSVFDGRNVRGEDIEVHNYVVVIYPADQDKRGWRSRYVAVLHPDAAGLFQSQPLPSGQYRAVAVPSLRQGEEHNVAFLQAADAFAEAFSLAKGATAQLRLRLARFQEVP